MSFHFECRINGDTRIVIADLLKEIADDVQNEGRDEGDCDDFDVDYKWSIDEEDD